MSNARSPREVCSTTMGTRGLIPFAPPSLSGDPDFRIGRGLLLLGRPEFLARPREIDRDRLDLGDDPIERAAEPEVLAQGLVAAALPDPLDHLVRVLLARLLRLLADELPQLVVGDL